MYKRQIGANSIQAAGGVFSLSKAGALVASNATITGNISASSGDFGGISIGANSIEAAGGVFSVNESGAVTATNLSSSGSISATSGDIGGFVIASGQLTSTGGTVNIKGATGQITASAVELQGDLEATSLQAASGSIGGFLMEPSRLSSGNLFAISASTVAHELFISSSEFKVSNKGAITASAARIDGDINAVRRNGKLYDKEHHTYEFTDETVECDVVWFFDWVDLPRPIQDYITARASSITSSRIIGDSGQYQMLQQKEAYMRAMALEYETSQGDYSFFGKADGSHPYISYQPYKALTR